MLVTLESTTLYCLLIIKFIFISVLTYGLTCTTWTLLKCIFSPSGIHICPHLTSTLKAVPGSIPGCMTDLIPSRLKCLVLGPYEMTTSHGTPPAGSLRHYVNSQSRTMFCFANASRVLLSYKFVLVSPWELFAFYSTGHTYSLKYFSNRPELTEWGTLT